MKHLFQFGICAAALLVASSAQAGPFEVYGAGARGSAMGAQIANPTNAWAIFYNVGGLAKAVPGFSVGGFATHNNAQILLKDRPPGYDIPELDNGFAARSTANQPFERQDTEEIDPLFALAFSGVTSLGIERLRLGFVALIPTSELVELNTHYVDERERMLSNRLHFEMIGGQTRRFAAEAGIAYEVADWISVGIGGTFLPGADVGTQVWIADPTDQSNIDINAAVKTTNRWGLLAGTQISLPHRVSVGLSYRGPVSFRIKGSNQLQIAGAEDGESQALDWTPKYSPGSYGLGLSWGIGAFELAGDVRWIRWSDYRDTQSDRPEFSDVVSGRLGLEYTHSDDTKMRAGLGFEPTGVPDQTGRTNYVDNARVLSSFGSTHRLTLAGLAMDWSWFLQFQWLVQRDVTKVQRGQYDVCAPGVTGICDEVPDDLINPETGLPFPEAQGLQTGNPGFPGFVSGGWIGALGMEVTF